MTPQEISEDLASKNNLMDQVNVIQPAKSYVAAKILARTEKVITAPGILRNGADAIFNRASERDTESERSMQKTVDAFNVMYDKDLTVVEGWQFMVCLKMARGAQGDFRLDDYEDEASYAALAGEAAACTSK